MIGLVRTINVPRPWFFARLLNRLSPSRGLFAGGVRVGRRGVRPTLFCGARALECVVEMYDGISPRVARARVCRAAEWLKSRGVRGVVTQSGFAFSDVFPPPSVEPLMRGLVCRMASVAVSQLFSDRPCVAVYAARASRELDSTVRALLRQLPTVSVSLESGAAAYASRMYAETGASLEIASSSVRRAGLCVVLDVPRGGFCPPDGAVVVACQPQPLGAYCGARLRLKKRLDFGDYSPLAAVAVLYETGVLRVSDIDVLEIVQNYALDIL